MNTFGRNEWKYILNKEDFASTVFCLASLMKTDKHGDSEGFYKVRSLYFDYQNDRCAFDVEHGANIRHKYRIRYYGETPDRLLLERKSKRFGICYKDDCIIDSEIFSDIIDGRTEKLLYKDSLLDEFAKEMIVRRLKPKIIIEYKRKAFTETISNTRITFDDNIRVSADYEHFLEGNYLSLPVNNDDEKIMEVKFDRLLPSYIKKICQSRNMFQTSFSKYYLGYRLLHGGNINEHNRYY